jgi:hypothetical protein
MKCFHVDLLSIVMMESATNERMDTLTAKVHSAYWFVTEHIANPIVLYPRQFAA